MSPKLTYLITGANRGIGKGLLDSLVLRPNTTVIAAVRDVPSAEKIFSTVPVGTGSRIITIKIDSTSSTDPFTAVQTLSSKYSIFKIDVLIANAGILDVAEIKPALESDPAAIRKHFEVNTIAPLLLIKAFAPYLQNSAAPKFFTLTSTLGSINRLETMKVPFFTYGISKAAANYLVRKVHFENEWLVSMAFNPGWVQTDMGNEAAHSVGMESAPMKFEDSIKALLELFDVADRETSGTFLEAGAKEIIPW